jgi:hypothetical protein
MAYKDIVVENKGRIVCVTLNRPERANAISVETSSELLEVFTEHRDYLKENHLMDDCFALLARNNRSQAVYYSGVGDRRQALRLCLQSLIFSCSPENLGFWFRASNQCPDVCSLRLPLVTKRPSFA